MSEHPPLEEIAQFMRDHPHWYGHDIKEAFKLTDEELDTVYVILDGE